MASAKRRRDAGPSDAVSLIIVHCGRVLLVKRARPPARHLYAFPGGRVETGETMEQAALRELTEETGLVARDVRFYRVYDLAEHDDSGRLASHFRLNVFRAELDAASPVTPVAADDALEAGWFGQGEVLDLPVPPSVRECITDILPEAGAVEAGSTGCRLRTGQA